MDFPGQLLLLHKKALGVQFILTGIDGVDDVAGLCTPPVHVIMPSDINKRRFCSKQGGKSTGIFAVYLLFSENDQ